MSDREKNVNIHIEKNPHIHEKLIFETDERVKMIYERYRTGRTIIMDDLKYMLLKNPEAFEKITRSIIQSKSGKEFSFESINIGNNAYEKKNIDSTNEDGNSINFTSSEGTPVETVVNVSDIMTSVRSIIENMSEKELMEISKNVYDPLELIKRIAVLKELEDTPLDKKDIYTYAQEKEFDISV